MSNIEVPENIQSIVQRVLDGEEFHMITTVALAEFIRDLNKPEIKAEPFVLYKVQVGEADAETIGFRVSKDVPYPWIILPMDSADKGTAYLASAYTQIYQDEDIKVLERWTPEALDLEFGIGDPGDAAIPDRNALVKGVVKSTLVDDDGDVLVRMNFGRGVATTHYVSAKDIAYVEENSGN